MTTVVRHKQQRNMIVRYHCPTEESIIKLRKEDDVCSWRVQNYENLL